MPSGSPLSRCTHGSLSQRGAISLPVLAEPAHDAPKGQIRKSKNGKRRAIILAIVQLLIFAHIALWLLSKKYGWFGGATISPVEPSESMEFTKSGVINAGLIFFSLAMLSTLVLGRWFCGWGCHIVMLQDLCGWIMKKCGVRPKPFRSRFLVYVPLVLALYMFIMPAVHRWGMIPLARWFEQTYGDNQQSVQALRDASWWLGLPIPSGELPQWKMQSHLTTTDFWKTFPGSYTAWVVIPVFLFICGFGVVYFLGAKGFCTYGCPYGGFFAPLDRLAPARILVTDACEHCGHCTAVCTSNVRVHEEVREYGMVVNPGCMKCLDCVSVCPNDALYFGFAKPALFKGKAKHEKPQRKYDLTLREEFAFAAVFVLTFLAMRGVYGFAMLMAVGLAGIMTFMTWKLWRMWRDPNVTLHQFQLKFKGRIKPAGWVYAAVAFLFVAWTAHSGAVNAAINSAKFHNAKVIVSQDAIFSPNPPQIPDEMRRHADIALRRLQLASSMRDGGIGLFRAGQWQTEIDMMMARLMAAKLEFDGAEQILRRAMRRDGVSDRFASSLTWVMNAQEGRAGESRAFARNVALENANFFETTDAYVQLCARAGDSASAESLLRAVIERDGVDDRRCARLMWSMAHQGRPGDAIAYGRPIVLAQRDFSATLDSVVNIAAAVGDGQAILDICRQRLEKFPDHLHTLRLLSIALRQAGSYDESLRITKRTIEIDPHNAPAYFFMAMTLADLSRLEEAEQALREALRLAPASVQYHVALADVLNALGRNDEAKAVFEKADLLQRTSQSAQHSH